MKELLLGLPLVRQLRSLYRLLRLWSTVLHQTSDLYSQTRNVNEAMLQQHVLNILSSERYSHPKRLHKHEYKVFSQNGEDGAIAEIFRRIKPASKVFVEIGAGTGLENNTTFLLLQGWTGYWIESDGAAVRSAQKEFRKEVRHGSLSLTEQFVTRENVERLLTDVGVPEAFDLLSLDIDRNTYWVWSSLRKYKPRVVVVEYNAFIPPEIDWKVTYRPNLGWNGTTYFGASLKAYEMLGRDLGYCLVGCNLTGVNAFFVQSELCKDLFLEPFTAENHYERFRHYLCQMPAGHPRAYTDIPDEGDS